MKTWLKWALVWTWSAIVLVWAWAWATKLWYIPNWLELEVLCPWDTEVIENDETSLEEFEGYDEIVIENNETSLEKFDEYGVIDEDENIPVNAWERAFQGVFHPLQQNQ